jgi:conjugative transfer ATPase
MVFSKKRGSRFSPFGKQAVIPDGQQRRRTVDKPPTKDRIRTMYASPQSFTNLLPWLEYDASNQCFLLDDGISVAALFEVEPIATEGRTEAFMVELRDKLQTVLTSLPEEQGSPWVVQFYLQDEANLADMGDTVAAYVKDRARYSVLTESYLDTLQAHFQAISRPGGLFNDRAVTGNAWRGQTRKIRVTLYRRRQNQRGQSLGVFQSPVQELNDVASKLVASLNAAGVRIQRCGGQQLYDWLFRWFNPLPDTDGNAVSYPGDDNLPFGFDFSEALMLGTPHSDKDQGIWWFDGLAHKVVTVQALRRVPAIGLLSSERGVGEHIFATFDRAPENTILVMTVVIRAQDEVRNHLSSIQHAAVGDNPEAKLAGLDAEAAHMEMAKGNKLFPVQMAFFMRGESEVDLHHKINRLNSLLLANNIQPIMERDDLISLDSYIRNLPMAYDYEHDKTTSRRSRLMFSRQAANLMPLYGRSTGTGHPGILLYNRGAEPLTFDPLNILDRKKNGHALIIGPTGAGKSALLVYLILHIMAVYRPRVFIIEAGNSFGLLGEYFKAHQVSVNPVSLTPGADVSLPPFGEALKLLEKFNRKAQREQLKAKQEEALLRSLEAGLDEDLEAEAEDTNNLTDDPNDDGRRDLLGEMEIAARIMITGGDVREDNRLTRADRLTIRHAILQAAKTVQTAGRTQVLTEDVVNALRSLPDRADRRLERAQDMADGMALFCDGLAGHFFNRPGIRWPDVDVTIVDMGILAREGYDDQLTVAYIGLMNHIHDLVEQQQHDHRPTLVITDEGHIITTNPLLSPYVIKIVKMWRKLGAWFWIATQSLEDFPDASRKMLSMLEWWLCLVMPKDEIEQISRFKDLNTEQKALLLAAKKSPGQYTEGVALTDEMTVLFRNVPPALALALAMTEKDEKARRKDLMDEHHCTELEAVMLVAQEIAQKRSQQ